VSPSWWQPKSHCTTPSGPQPYPACVPSFKPSIAASAPPYCVRTQTIITKAPKARLSRWDPSTLDPAGTRRWRGRCRDRSSDQIWWDRFCPRAWLRWPVLVGKMGWRATQESRLKVRVRRRRLSTRRWSGTCVMRTEKLRRKVYLLFLMYYDARAARSREYYVGQYHYRILLQWFADE